MCLSKYSNLEHLRAVAINLCSSDDVNMNELCERELSALINIYYQDQRCEVASNGGGEKRKSEVDTCSDNKKLRVFNKVSNILSALELVPNEVYEIILKGLGGEDKKNLRSTSKILYNKTTMLAPLFKNWGFEATFGVQPDFVLEGVKDFCVSVRDNEIGPVTNLLKHVNRISSLQIEIEGVILDFLNKKPAMFIHLTSIDLESVYFDEDTLEKLAPQLEHLRLSNLKYSKCEEDDEEFDNSRWYPEFSLQYSVDEESDCFTKLKTLKIEGNIEIDMTKILTKCCKTLEHLELTDVNSFKLDLQHQLQSLNSLIISCDFKDFEPILKKLLSKCSGSLRTLEIDLDYNTSKTDFSSLLEETMKIIKLEITSDKGDIEQFLSKCPLIQNLTLNNHEKELHQLVLKDLLRLELVNCTARCVTSVLKHASNSSLKTLCLRDSGIAKDVIAVIPELDTVMLLEGRDDRETTEGQLSKLFPTNAQVTKELIGDDKIVLRRKYHLP